VRGQADVDITFLVADFDPRKVHEWQDDLIALLLASFPDDVTVPTVCAPSFFATMYLVHAT
jgi:hypothetical protein